MQRILSAVLFCVVATTTAAWAQDKPSATSPAPANVISTFNKGIYAGVKGIILQSAEKMPEENYSFKPTEAVRSYGQILGHVADAQYLFCSNVLGEKNPSPKIEDTKKTKAELIAALKDGFAYCDKAYDGMTDASGAQTINFFGGDKPKLGVLSMNNLHTVEHYGNLITYMRLKNIVPPTSEPKPVHAHIDFKREQWITPVFQAVSLTVAVISNALADRLPWCRWNNLKLLAARGRISPHSSASVYQPEVGLCG